MSVAAVTEQHWTGASIDTALVHINTALACLRRIRDNLAECQSERALEEARKAKQAFEDAPQTRRVFEEARLLKLHLERNPSACTADGLACCSELLEARGS